MERVQRRHFCEKDQGREDERKGKERERGER